jgi:hypothetical protein
MAVRTALVALLSAAAVTLAVTAAAPPPRERPGTGAPQLLAALDHQGGRGRS